jgi:hypothetical protein
VETFKKKAYKKNPHIPYELEEVIRPTIMAISTQELQTVSNVILPDVKYVCVHEGNF